MQRCSPCCHASHCAHIPSETQPRVEPDGIASTLTIASHFETRESMQEHREGVGEGGGGFEAKEASANQHVCELAVLREMNPWEATNIPGKQQTSMGKQEVSLGSKICLWDSKDIPGTA